MLIKITILAIWIGISNSNIYAEGTVSRGAELYDDCEVCHGEYAQGDEDFGAPRLSGQHSWYLITQLSNFRDSLRGTHADDDNGQIMAPMASELTDQDIKDVSAYIQTLGIVIAGEDSD